MSAPADLADGQMLVLPGPVALSPFRVANLTTAINQSVNSSVVIAIRSAYVHCVALKDSEPGKPSNPLLAPPGPENSARTLLDALLQYDSPVDTADPLTQALLKSISDSATEPDTYVLRIFPRQGTISPWSSKATNIAQVCGLENYVDRIERGLVILIQVRKGFPMQDYLKDPAAAGLESVFDRMTQIVLAKPPTYHDLFARHSPKPLGEIAVLGAKNAREKLQQANVSLGLALDNSEIDYLLEIYAHAGRNPTDVELFMFAQVNSEHCRHKIFNADWTIDDEKKPYTLFQMIRHTHKTNPAYTVSAYSDNAAVLEGFDAFFYAPDPKSNVWTLKKEIVHYLAKVETHNHPTAVSPFPGAATGSGGEIRDEGAVGRGSKSKAGLSGFAVSDLLIPDMRQPWELDVGKPDHISSALDIMLEAPIGSAAFNNEFGRPCITGYFRTLTTKVINAHGKQEIRGFHKPIMVAGGMGAIRPQFALKNRRITPGAAIIVLGGPSILIGLGGGAASSVSSGDGSAELDFASVQRGNPEMQRRAQQVIDACVALGSQNPIQSIHDVGAGGLSNALPELVHDNGLGARFELRDVPCVEPGMSPMEIWCCEAQERYVLAVAQQDVELFRELCARERAEFAVVGHATSEERLVLTDRLLGTTPIDIEMSKLFGKPPKMSRKAVTAKLRLEPFDGSLTTYLPAKEPRASVSEALDRVLHLPAVASKSFLITIGDRTVTGLVYRDQMVGPWQVPVADVAVTGTSLGEGVITGEAMAMGEKPPLALISPAASAQMAVAESLLNLYAAGISDLARVRLSANWMCAASHDGEGAGLYEAVQAIGLHLCPELGISIPVGKDSMSMKMKWPGHEVTAPLAVNITAFGPVDDVSGTWTPQLLRLPAEEPSVLVHVDLAADVAKALGGSAVAQVFGQVGDSAPAVRDVSRLKNLLLALQYLHQSDDEIVLAYHDVSDGGLVVAALEMAFAGRVGLEMEVSGAEGEAVAELFAEELGCVMQVREADVAQLKAVFAQFGIAETYVKTVAKVVPHGSGQKDQPITVAYNGEILIASTRAQLQQAWAETSYRLQQLRDNPKTADQEFLAIQDNQDPGLSYKLTFDPTEVLVKLPVAERPKVAILREQGVNGHQEMAYSFQQAGFTPVDVHMTDILSGDVTLADFVGLAACGGFSYGDVLGAGSGWAKSVLWHEKAYQEFSHFFNDRSDTFAFGACNGCQFLSKLTQIIPGAEHWPSFERNTSEQYEARVCMVEIVDEAETPSVFLNGMRGSKLPIAVAHGEGRASFSSPDKLKKLLSDNLVSVRYVDNYGKVTEKYPFNPNGSPNGITGVRTPNGRVLIMMPHPERVVQKEANSWYPKEEGAAWGEVGPWVRLFRSARRWVGP